MSGGGPARSALVATVAPHDDEAAQVTLVSPMIGWWQPHVTAGRVVQAGEPIGTITVLGVVHAVVAGPGAHGAVVRSGSARREVAVGFGDALVTLDRTAAERELHASEREDRAAAAAGGLVIRAPSSGRFYGRPGPGKPPFVAVGDTVTRGQTVGLLEVMKSFHRVTAGDDLPAGARVTAIVVADDADVDAGAELVRLEVPS